MNKEHVAYFDKLIQDKIEQLPRAIEGKAPLERLEEICMQLRILKDAKEHFLYTVLIDYTKISDNQHVIQLIKKREKLEKQIIKIDKMALVKYELEALNLNE